MALKSAAISMRAEIKTEWMSNSTKVTSETSMEDNVKFTDGSGASQFDDIIEASINANSSPVALSTLTSPSGASGSTFTKLKGIGVENPSANAAITLTSSITGLVVGKIDPGAKYFVPYPSAAGLTVSGASTLTATGTPGQFVRVILLLA